MLRSFMPFLYAPRCLRKIGWYALGVLLWLWACGAAAQAPQTAVAAQVAAPASVKQTVWGILGYARWPGHPPTIQLCLVGETPYGAVLQLDEFLPDGRQVLARRVALEGHASLEGCHALYAGRLRAGQWQRLMASRPPGQPLLTLSEDPAYCQQGGMFCLDMSRPQVGFELSLDSLARSGVRVNPRVLGLSRYKEAN